LQRFERRGQFESSDTRNGRKVLFWHEPGDFEDEFVAGGKQSHGLGKLSFYVCLHNQSKNGLVDCWVVRME